MTRWSRTGRTDFELERNLNDLLDRFAGDDQVDLYRIVAGFEGDFDAFGGETWSGTSHTTWPQPRHVLAGRS